MDILKEVTQNSARWELLQLNIKSRLRAYVNLVNDYQEELKFYRQRNVSEKIIRSTEDTILKLEAKIELLTNIK